MGTRTGRDKRSGVAVNCANLVKHAINEMERRMEDDDILGDKIGLLSVNVFVLAFRGLKKKKKSIGLLIVPDSYNEDRVRGRVGVIPEDGLQAEMQGKVKLQSILYFPLSMFEIFSTSTQVLLYIRYTV